MTDPSNRRGRFRIEEADGVLRLTRTWFWLPTVLLFCALAPYFLWLGIGRSSALPFLLGLVFVYALALFLINRTTLEMSDGRLTITHGPIPSLLRNRTFDTRTIVHIYSEADRFPGSGEPDYEVRARTAAGETLVLLSDLPDLEQARLLERMLATRLGLVPPPADVGGPAGG